MPTLNTQGVQKVSLLQYIRQPLFKKVQKFLKFFSAKKNQLPLGEGSWLIAVVCRGTATALPTLNTQGVNKPLNVTVTI
ncbi:hypothetical protein NX722_22250 [Endozoicomonas gorgoniicola]|uniref:Uncharacterized protein n=1 Tax=Endozoicomonas gorgoniicola TaxID=1234144 RepID=A0ABT3N270_9GAMM|nr:hypothetical protein [Endozoicomonas gorgoniicola]MCW7555299.1 hypothetical protein [Endozoicomonas gorgoniicola]